MNGMSYQQQGFQNQSNQSNNNRYQPAGYVQSHYQGQMSQPRFGQSGNFGSQQFSQAGFASQNNAMGNSGFQSNFQGNAQTPNNPVYQATNARSQSGPVIAHTGYTANSNQFGGQNSFNQSASFQTAQAHTQNNPVYQATNAASQAGPVLSHLGYQAGNNQNQANASRFAGTQSFQSGFQGQAQTHNNPVYQATNAAAQEGPVINHLGYQSNAQGNIQGQSQFGGFANSNNRF